MKGERNVKRKEGMALREGLTEGILSETMKAYLTKEGFQVQDSFFTKDKGMEKEINEDLSAKLWGLKMDDTASPLASTTIALMDGDGATNITGGLSRIPQRLVKDYGAKDINGIYVVLTNGKEEELKGILRSTNRYKEKATASQLNDRVFITVSTLTCLVDLAGKKLYFQNPSTATLGDKPKGDPLYDLCVDMLAGLMEPQITI